MKDAMMNMMNMMRGDAGRPRRINREALLAALRASGPAGNAELSVRTGLSVATCANILPDLVADGLALELAERESRGGRPARKYAYNPDHLLVAALALSAARGGARLAHVVANAAGVAIARGEERFSRMDPETIDAALRDLRARHPALRAVAVSVPGVVRDGVIGICDLPELSGLALERRIGSEQGLEAAIDNDMNFAALGYLRRQAAPDASSLVFMVFPRDNCAGAGVIVNGRPVRGKSNFAGEISFIPVSGGRDAGTRLHADPAKAKRHIARLIASATGMINPDIVVLSGDAVREDMLPDIRRRCLSLVPAEHLPELVVQLDYNEYCFEGMTAAALDRLSLDIG